MLTQNPPLQWLEPGDKFPSIASSWDENTSAPGLLAAGGALNIDTLSSAYSQGIFPWFSENQPILWWSPNPRMVLDPLNFRVHPSFRKTLVKFSKSTSCEIRMDSAFEQVIDHCARSLREGQAGTWILPDMISAYIDLYRAGLAHSVETWIDDKLVGGLYCVAIGRSVFGESMFSTMTDTSKIALAAMVSFCRHHGIAQIDCQQNTRHLRSLGAEEISRDSFLQKVAFGLNQPAPQWKFEPKLWQEIIC